MQLKTNMYDFEDMLHKFNYRVTKNRPHNEDVALVLELDVENFMLRIIRIIKISFDDKNNVTK